MAKGWPSVATFYTARIELTPASASASPFLSCLHKGPPLDLGMSLQPRKICLATRYNSTRPTMAHWEIRPGH